MPREEADYLDESGRCHVARSRWSGRIAKAFARQYRSLAPAPRTGLCRYLLFALPDSETPLEETLAALEHIVRQGKAHYVGLSHYPRANVEEVVELTRRLHLASISVCQNSYNLFHRESEQELKEIAQNSGIGIVACSPLSQGLLSKRYLEGFPEESRGAKVWSEQQRAAVTPELKERIRKLNEIAEARDQTLPQMAIAWVLSQPGVTSTLMGASDIAQIEENVRALNNPKFSEEELRRIDTIVAD